MLKINEIHKAWWNESLVVCSFTHNEYIDIDAFYNIATGCVEEYSFMHDTDGEILNEITGEYEYIPASEIKNSRGRRNTINRRYLRLFKE